MQPRTYRTTMRGGPDWSKVVALLTTGSEDGRVNNIEKGSSITRSFDHGLVQRGLRNPQTILVFEVEKVPETEHDERKKDNAMAAAADRPVSRCPSVHHKHQLGSSAQLSHSTPHNMRVQHACMRAVGCGDCPVCCFSNVDS